MARSLKIGEAPLQSEKAINIAPPLATLREARKRARALIAPHAWSWLESGSEQEYTLRANRTAFTQFRPVQRILCDVSNVQTAKSLLGVELPFPLIAAPLGGLTQFHLDGEIAFTQGCGDASSIASVSAMARLRVEDARAAAPTAAMIYQVYFQGPDEWLEQEIERAKTIDVVALCLCGDAPVRTIRYQDRENRYDARKMGHKTNPSAPSHALGARANWDYVRWVKQRIDVPVIVKGVSCVADARLAMSHGADMVWVSNHGGRVLDSGIASLYALAEIRAALGPSTPLLFDGGVRGGVDILIALALGADIVAAGRPFVYGLAVDGAAGVSRTFEMFCEEFSAAMAMCGVTELGEIDPSLLRTQPTANSILDSLR